MPAHRKDIKRSYTLSLRLTVEERVFLMGMAKYHKMHIGEYVRWVAIRWSKRLLKKLRAEAEKSGADPPAVSDRGVYGHRSYTVECRPEWKR